MPGPQRVSSRPERVRRGLIKGKKRGLKEGCDSISGATGRRPRWLPATHQDAIKLLRCYRPLMMSARDTITAPGHLEPFETTLAPRRPGRRRHVHVNTFHHHHREDAERGASRDEGGSLPTAVRAGQRVAHKVLLPITHYVMQPVTALRSKAHQ